jgi:Phosphatase-1 catalytic subunit binding region
MLTWTHAHRAARKGDWERFARDADRFRERIDSTAAILAPILDPSHRDRVRRRNLEYDASNSDGSHLK